ncbi:DUF1273 domain-containing protein [Rossellomorea aquimaris]|uniref:DUF1273 domain-containing protein n=1 Tax=Rossellomorea aquimaris TaxID=189382 RepID=UPI001CD504DF|nr:DUF1273 domain-containing protein [Rossellomorea aquimaris]MCA1054591.1 DUF1273 domain-containing protein [Rossellomorea aquimaris]
MGKVACLTGYKSFELGIFKQEEKAIHYIKQALRKELLSLLDEGLEWVTISGQLGVELWGAEVVFELQEEYPDLKLAVLTPFLDQEENWNDTNKEYYEMILSQADFVDSISKEPYKSPQQFRNRNLLFLHKSQYLVVLYDVEKEGSPKYFYEEARRYQESHPEFQIRSISFQDLQWIVEEEQWKDA